MMTVFLVWPEQVHILKAQAIEETVASDLVIEPIVLKVEEYLTEYAKDFPTDDLETEKTDLKEYLFKKLEVDGFTEAEIVRAFKQMEKDRVEEIIYLAESFLDEEPLLSRNALILKFEEEFYSQEKVELGLESIAVDWNEQAVKASERYVNTEIKFEDEIYLLISRKSLREFLVGEKYFTLDETNYGLEKSTIDWDEQAFKQAQYYLAADAYSEKELVKKLKLDDFSSEEVAYGITKTEIDWKEQAVKKAESFLAQQLLQSKEDLKKHLKQAGFLDTEVDYAIKKLFKGEEEEELEVEEPTIDIPEVFIPKRPIIIKPLDFIANHIIISAQAATNKQEKMKESAFSQSSLTTTKKSQSFQKDTPKATEAEDPEDVEGTSFFDSPNFIPVILVLVVGNLYLFQKS